MKKIPLEQLAAYFPYGVKAIFPETNKKGCRTKVIGTINAIYDDSTINCYDTVNASPDKFKLVLYDFSNSKISKREYYKSYSEQEIFHYYRKELLKARVDLFRLIEQGLAVSVHDLKEDPYKIK